MGSIHSKPDRLSSLEAREIGASRLLQGNWSNGNQPTLQSRMCLVEDAEPTRFHIDKSKFNESVRCLPVKAELLGEKRVSLVLERCLQPLPSVANNNSSSSKQWIQDYTLITPVTDNPSKVMLTGGLTQLRPFNASGIVKKQWGAPLLSTQVGLPMSLIIPGLPGGSERLTLDERQASDLLYPLAELIRSNQHLKISRTTVLSCRARLDAEDSVMRGLEPDEYRNCYSYRLKIWMQELESTDDSGDPILRLQYLLCLHRRRPSKSPMGTLCGQIAGTLFRQDQLG